MKNSKAYIIIAFILFLTYAIHYQWSTRKHFFDLLNKEGVYTIGTIKKIKALSKGGPLSQIIYSYNNISNEGEYIGDLDAIQKPYVGEHFFIKIIPNNPKLGIYLNPNCLVPDSITAAPPRGWSLEWMKKHFPDCAK